MLSLPTSVFQKITSWEIAKQIAFVELLSILLQKYLTRKGITNHVIGGVLDVSFMKCLVHNLLSTQKKDKRFMTR